ncbi:MAG: hypothetical protein KGR48_03205 [Alphaproteobacteria bacterium]|nr:hypothetical protein [Alphaproteobacteria bacterium]MBU6471247.1 hypothetical protein [Alphaproteobacteria bacterium]MDE2014074.1 hypothetical protein [Alphaproteobacteria bacterium]MDE2073090.1 hypothetical protein [Alphaproteobacteria bacterium]MDE2352109.1 hypothetical protein [Alphaproteobacteria bacterium]
MKAIAIGSLIASLALGAAWAQGAPPQPQKHTPPVCLWTYMIDHTHTVDAKTLLFYMKGGKIWKNTLQNRCPSLTFHGFAYITRDGQICSNQQVIYVLQTHEVCMLGTFEPYTPPAKPKP